MKSESLRFDSAWRIRTYHLSHAHDKTKDITFSTSLPFSKSIISLILFTHNFYPLSNTTFERKDRCFWMCKLPFSRQWYLICRLTPKSQQVTVTVCWYSFKILNGKRRQKLKVYRLYISLQCRRLVGASYRYKFTIVYLRWGPGKSENLYCPTRPMFWPSFTP